MEVALRAVVREPSTYLIVLPWDVLPWNPRSAGGVSEVVRNLLRCVSADGTWRPGLLVSSWVDPRPSIMDGEPVLTVRSRLWGPARPGSAFGFLRSVARAPLGLQRLDRVLSRERVAVVNLHYASSCLWAFVLLRRLARRRFRLVVSFHGLDVQAIRDATAGERRAWRRALLACDALVCCSEALAREVVETLPALRARVAVIHNGIDPHVTFQEVEHAALPAPLAGRCYVACVATFEHKKGLDVLVHAFARLAGSLADTDLVIVGREEAEHAAIEALVEQLGLRDRVHLLTDVPHPVALRIIQSARVFALPSRREPFGLVLLEAGVFGVPIVATSVGGVPEVVLDGETGRLVPPDDEGALADAIERTLRDTAESARLAQAMCERVRKHFSWDEAFAKYRAVALGEALAVGAAGRPLLR